MSHASVPLSCACCSLHRRQFLSAGCAAAGACGLLGTLPALAAKPAEGKTRVRIIFALHAAKQARPDWPNIGFDFEPVMKRIEAELAKALPQFEFPTAMAVGPEDAKKILDADKDANIDGYLVYQMNCWNRVVQTVAAAGKPTLYADFQYGGSGGFLVYTSAFLRREPAPIGFVASSNMADLVAAVKCFELVKRGGSVNDFVAAVTEARKQGTGKAQDIACLPDKIETLPIAECVKKLRQSKILAVGNPMQQSMNSIQERLGIEVVAVPYAELNDAWQKADKEASKALADAWQNAAVKVEGVERATLEGSAAMYLAQKAVLKKHGAEAITINCLGGFYGKHIHAYPCLGFHQLLNEGMIGACECDLRSTATMVAMTALTQGRPGFISDPVIDTAKGQIIYAHCVASNRAFGPKGEVNPYQILTHSEDRQGASLRSTLPLRRMTTTLEFFSERKQVLTHQGIAVANDEDDRACRTKLACQPVGDIEKLFREWDQWGWHRVTYYGDLKEPVSELAKALGFEVRQEA